MAPAAFGITLTEERLSDNERRMSREPQTTLLRVSAFLVDTLSVAVLLVLPAAMISYGVIWFGISGKIISHIWYGALFVLMVFLLLRDGWRGRSPGKRMLGLRVQTASGKPCGYARSALRNFPLIFPVWNVLELILVLTAPSALRTGDRMAGTMVSEE